MLLKSGINDIHGELLGIMRTTALTANLYFANAAGVPQAETDYKNFGGFIGGPIIIPKVHNGKNRTFFFVSAEAYRQHLPYTNTFGVPTALERVGNYSGPGSVAIYDPLSTRPCTSTDNCPSGVTQIRTPFAGNISPASRINLIGQAIINDAFPLPNTTCAKLQTDCQNFTGTQYLYFGRGDQYAYKLEHTVTNWLRLTGLHIQQTREQGGSTWTLSTVQPGG